MIKKQYFEIAIIVILLLFNGFANHQVKAVSDQGDYIHVKLDTNDIGLDDFWEFRSVAGTYLDYDVTGTTYNTKECALFLQEETGLVCDSVQILWVPNQEIIQKEGISLNDSINTYERCCIYDGFGGPSPSCEIQSSAFSGNPIEVCINCDWDPGLGDGPKDVFDRAYSAGWDNMAGAFTGLAVSGTEYRPKTDLLCETTWKQCGAAEASCKDYNARTYACKNGNWTKCTGTATPDCLNGVCVAPAGLTLEMSTSNNILSPLGTATITFTVELSGSGVAGATINGITATSGTIAGSCTPTNASGKCTLTYTAPAAVPGVNPVVISATDASNGVNTDSGPASVIISINGCPAGPPPLFLIPMGGCASLPTICASNSKRYQYLGANDGINCIPNIFNCPDGCNATCDACLSCATNTCIGVGAGTKWCDGGFVPGVWRDCPGAACCPAVGPPPPPPPPPCVATEIPETTCDDGVDNDCDLNIDCADVADCPDGTGCGGANFSNGGACVECATNVDCAANEVCDSGSCIPCSGEGVAETDPLLCCSGLNIIDGVCTSACDPNASFFCNPLRQSVETLVEGGEKMIGYILGLIGSVALLLVIIAGIMYMTSAGSEEKIASSKKILT
ncbi:MAG: Ig-like domain-containing protein, partial [Candidatus Pacebacteria bacterium]|nr:Ig-like domain-containing protein [Candidatus Paceibacterota bacterium]